MERCSRCGSFAINHHCHGRDGSDPDLCDVCYWRKRAEFGGSIVTDPLTDGQIDAIWREKPRYHAAPIGVTDIEFARDIEAAAHGIKKENGNG